LTLTLFPYTTLFRSSDYVAGTGAFEIVERDDGFIGAASPAMYVVPYTDWPEYQKTALRHATGRVLDIGCGAGRHALYLQDKGLRSEEHTSELQSLRH